MRRLTLITGVFCIVLLSCSRGESDVELLYGHWQLAPGPGITVRPTVDFYEDGTYKIIDYIKNPFFSQAIITGTVTGDFSYAQDRINLVTATVEMEDNSGGIGMPDGYITFVGGSSIGSLYGSWTGGTNPGGDDPRYKPQIFDEYQPVVWHILMLSDKALQVRTPTFETLTYHRQ